MDETLQEMIFQMNPRAGVGSIRGSWAQAQNAHIAMSPFQQKTLAMMTEMIAYLSRAASDPAHGAYTSDGFVGNLEAMAARLMVGGV